MEQSDTELSTSSLAPTPLAATAEGNICIETDDNQRRGQEGTTSSDYEQNNPVEFIRFVERHISSDSGSEASDDMSRRASTAFLQAAAAVPEECRGTLTLGSLLRLMATMMAAKGDAAATLRRYSGRLRALHALFSDPTPESEKAFARLRAFAEEERFWRSYDLSMPLRRLMRLTADPLMVKEEWTQEFRLMQWLFFSGMPSLEEAADIRFDTLDEPTLLPQELRIAEQQRQPRRKFLFALDQGKNRMPAITRRTAERLAAFALSHGIEAPGVKGLQPLDLIRGMRAEAAMQQRLGVAAVRSLFDSRLPSSHPWLGMLSEEDILTLTTEAQRLDARAAVAAHLQPTVLRWYVMQLRHNVSPDDFRQWMEEKEPSLAENIEYYYPTYTLTVRKGKKKVAETKPYIPQMLFYRTLPSLPARIFATAGNLAWGLRTTRDQNAPYSVIPDTDMILFRRVIGQLPAGTAFGLSEAEPIKKGQRVRVTGGIMKGYEGTVVALPADSDKDNENDSHPMLFQLVLSSDSALRWTVDIEDQYLQPI